ncbi:MAG: hypothetical protein LC808_37950 [Actinobacteria bacterium]|nr:hypothetical protein [Actinomycetota bacterium]
MKMARRLAVGLAAIVLLGACGGGGESSAPTTTAGPTTTLSQIDLDRAKAKRIVLTAVDVPGFTVDPPDPGDESASFDDAANACGNNNPVLVRLGEDDDPRGARSEDYIKGDDVGVGSSATFAETEEEARSAITALMASSFSGCFSRAVATALRSDPTFTNVTVNTTRLPALTVGDQSFGYRSVARGRVSGTAVVLNIDFTFVRVGRAVAVLGALSVDSPFPDADRVRLATAIADRMAGP